MNHQEQPMVDSEQEIQAGLDVLRLLLYALDRWENRLPPYDKPAQPARTHADLLRPEGESKSE